MSADAALDTTQVVVVVHDSRTGYDYNTTLFTSQYVQQALDEVSVLTNTQCSALQFSLIDYPAVHDLHSYVNRDAYDTIRCIFYTIGEYEFFSTMDSLADATEDQRAQAIAVFNERLRDDCFTEIDPSDLNNLIYQYFANALLITYDGYTDPVTLRPETQLSTILRGCGSQVCEDGYFYLKLYVC